MELRRDEHIIVEGKSDGSPTIYKIPLNTGKSHKSSNYKMYSFGNEEAITKCQRVIMFVGATGSGKSTIINFMINYILQVKWNDQFRFKIISDKEEDESGSQAKSKTQTLVCYTIHPSASLKLDYTLTIIDTPGFGDTRGLQQDRLIADKIHEFFTNSAQHHIDHIDAIGFVAQASLARLTRNQKYVFESILAIFGKDIKDNIIMLATFADHLEPKIKDAIKEAEIPCTDKIYKFNNSDWLQHGSMVSGESPDLWFWNMGMDSMKDLFLSLDELQPKCLSLTAEVLRKRKQLERTLEGLKDQIRIGFSKLDQLKSELKILKGYKADVEKNKDHTYTVRVTKTKKTNLEKRNSMNCTYCAYTCHQPCMSLDIIAGWCDAFNSGSCTVCPGRCSSKKHFVQDFKHEIYTEEEEKTYQDVAARYQEAARKTMSHEEIVKKHKEELHEVLFRVTQLIAESRSTLSRLNEIALRPDPLNAVDYIDMLIETEKTEKRMEWQSRVNALQDIRKNADLLAIIRQENPDRKEQEKGQEMKLGRLAPFTSWFSNK